jgi:hypothetical protein
MVTCGWSLTSGLRHTQAERPCGFGHPPVIGNDLECWFVDRHARDAVEVRRTHRIRLPDAIVWASARSESAVLVTRNTGDFPEGESGARVPYSL